MHNAAPQTAARTRVKRRQSLGFEIAMSPRWWTTVAALRHFIAAFLKPVLQHPALANQVALAAHELLENALKYSATEESRVRVRVSILPDHICLRVRNQADPAAVLLLKEVFAMVQSGDALETYLARICPVSWGWHASVTKPAQSCASK